MVEGEFIMDNNTQQTEGINITICKFDSLVLYEITDDELEQLQSSSKICDIMLNAVSFLGSACISLIVSLLTTTMSDLVKNIFVVSLVFGVFFFVLLLIISLVLFKNKKTIVKKIKSRVGKNNSPAGKNSIGKE